MVFFALPLASFVAPACTEHEARLLRFGRGLLIAGHGLPQEVPLYSLLREQGNTLPF